MKFSPGKVIVAGLCLFCSPAYSLAWEGKRDDKAVEELQLMTDGELCWEAEKICSPASIYPRLSQDGLAYAQRILVVTRARHEGTAPQWAETVVHAIIFKDSKSCRGLGVTCSNMKLDEILQQHGIPKTTRDKFFGRQSEEKPNKAK